MTSNFTTPPTAAAQPVLMFDYSKYKVKTDNLEVPEFCFYVRADLSLRDNKTRRNNPTDANEAANIVSTVGVILSAMMNSSGGVLHIEHVNSNNKAISTWLNTLNDKLYFIPKSAFNDCISIDIVEGRDVFMYVRKCKSLIVLTHMYFRSPVGSNYAADLCRAKDIIFNREIRPLVLSDKYSRIQLSYDFQMPPEGMHLEYKHYRYEDDVTVLINKISDSFKVIFSLANCEGGGCFIVGVEDSLKVKGVKLTETQKYLVKDWLNGWLNKADEQKRIWGRGSRVATEGVDWTLTYIPVFNHPGGGDHYVLELALYQCPGGVFTKPPEFYTVDRSGDIIRQPHDYLIHLLVLSQTQTLSVDSVQGGSVSPAFTSSSITPPSGTYPTYPQQNTSTQTNTSSHFPLFLRASWRQCTDWEPLAGSAEPTHRKPSGLLQMKDQLKIYGEKNLLGDFSGDVLEHFCGQLSLHFTSVEGWALVVPALGPCMPDYITVPSDHIYDAVVCLKNNKICLISYFKISTTDVNIRKECRQYLFQIARLLKYQILFEMNNSDAYCDVKLDTLILTDIGLSDTLELSPIKDFYYKSISTNILEDVLRQQIELCISSNKTWIRNRLGALKTYYLTEEQIIAYRRLLNSILGIIEAAPGCGKSIIGNRLCHEYGSREKVLYAGPGEGFLALIKYQGIADVVYVSGDDDIQKVEDCLKMGSYELVVMDDVQAMSCQKPFWEKLLKTAFTLKKKPKIVFLCDSKFQDHYQKNTVNKLKEALNEFTRKKGISDVLYLALDKNMRNSRITHSFLIAQIETSDNKCLTPRCGNDVEGDDVVFEVVENAMEDSKNNKLLQLLDGLFRSVGDHLYVETDVMLLICDGNQEQAHWLREIISRHRKYRTCRAVDVPHQGMVVDEVDSVVGMESNVCILLWLRDTSNTDNVKFRAFAASRGVMQVTLVFPRYFSPEEATKLGLQDLTSVTGRMPDGYNPVTTRELQVPVVDPVWGGIRGLTVSALGDLYLADAGNRQIRHVSLESGQQLSVIPVPGVYRLQDVCMTPGGDLAVACVNTVLLLTTGGNIVWESGPGQYDEAVSIAGDQAGHLYVTDSDNSRVSVLDGAGTLLYHIGEQRGETGLQGPRSIAVHPQSGRVYVCDYERRDIAVYTRDGVYERRISRFERPLYIAFRADGLLAVCDRDKVKVRDDVYNYKVYLLRDDRPIQKLDIHTESRYCGLRCVFLPGGDLVVCVDGRLWFFSTESREDVFPRQIFSEEATKLELKDLTSVTGQIYTDHQSTKAEMENCLSATTQPEMLSIPTSQKRQLGITSLPMSSSPQLGITSLPMCTSPQLGITSLPMSTSPQLDITSLPMSTSPQVGITSLPTSLSKLRMTSNVKQEKVIKPVIMYDYSQYKVWPENLKIPEFCFDMTADLSLRDNIHFRRNNPVEAEAAADFITRVGIILSAMMNTSGGFLHVRHVKSDNKAVDAWLNTLSNKLSFIPKSQFDRCIYIEVVRSQDVFIFVRKSDSPIVRTHMYCRSPVGSSSEVNFDLAKEIILSKKRPIVEPLPLKMFPYGFLSYDNIMPHESMHLEYKHFVILPDVSTLIQRVSGYARNIFSLANCKGGGYFIIGIDDQSLKVKGVKLSGVEQTQFGEWLRVWLVESDGKKRIWGNESRKPCEGADWRLEFIPVVNHPYGSDHYVCVLTLYQCIGGVFTRQPEFYNVDISGEIVSQPYAYLKEMLTVSQRQDPPGLQPWIIPTKPQQNSSSQMEMNQSTHLPLFSQASYRQCTQWELFVNKGERNLKKPRNLLPMCNPLNIYKERNFGKDPSGDVLRVFCEILTKKFEQVKGWALVVPLLLPLHFLVEIPYDHVYDAVVCMENSCIYVISHFTISSSYLTIVDKQNQYVFELARVLKHEILFELPNSYAFFDVKLDLLISSEFACTDAIKSGTIEDFYLKSIRTDFNDDPVTQRIESLLSSNIVWFKNRLESLKTIYLTEEQLNAYRGLLDNKIGLIEAAPGCGKSIIGTHLCCNYQPGEVLFAGPGKGFLALIGYQNIAVVVHVSADDDLQKVKDHLDKGSYKLLVFDDIQAMQFTQSFWKELLETVFLLEKTPKVVFLYDSRFQNHYGYNTVDVLKTTLSEFTVKQNIPDVCYLSLCTNMRNSRIVHSFLVAQIEERNKVGLAPECGNDVQGDDVAFEVIENALEDSTDNKLLKLLDDIFTSQGDHRYEATDVMLLLCDGDEKPAQTLREIINRYRADYKPGRAEHVPHQGIIVDVVDSAIGLEANVCILVWLKDTRNIDNLKFRVFAASRGVMRVIVVFPRHFTPADAHKLGLQDLTSVTGRMPDAYNPVPIREIRLPGVWSNSICLAAVSEVDNLLLVDAENKQIHVLSSEFKLKSCLPLSRPPLDACLMPNGDLAVACGDTVERYTMSGMMVEGGGLGHYMKACSIASDHSGRLYVCDVDNDLVSVLDEMGCFLHHIGAGLAEGCMEAPVSVAIHPQAGRIYVADTSHRQILVYNLDGIYLHGLPNVGQPCYITFRADSLLAVCDIVGVVHLLRDDRLIQTLHLGRFCPQSCIFMPDGDLVVCDRDGLLRVFSTIQ